MKEVSLDNINKSVLSLLTRLEKDMNGAEHQTGPFGNIKSKKPSKKKIPNSIEEETNPTQILKKVIVLNKMDIADTEVNGGFGTTPDDDEDEDDTNHNKVTNGNNRTHTHHSKNEPNKTKKRKKKRKASAYFADTI